jgi:hypothetical protein
MLEVFQNKPRDIVFILDCSKSMERNNDIIQGVELFENVNPNC